MPSFMRCCTDFDQRLLLLKTQLVGTWDLGTLPGWLGSENVSI
jgi:hypothetical protein